MAEMQCDSCGRYQPKDDLYRNPVDSTEFICEECYDELAGDWDDD